MTELSDKQLEFVRKYLGARPGDMSGDRSLVELQKLRLDWDKTRTQIQREVETLERAIVDAFKDQPEARSVAISAKELRRIMVMIDGRLLDKLDDALNAEDPGKRRALERQAARIVDDYMARVKGDGVIAMVDDNPFVTVSIRARLAQVLPQLRDALA